MGPIAIARTSQRGHQMDDFAAVRRTGSRADSGATSTLAGGCRHAQGGDPRRTRVEIGLLGRLRRWAPTRTCAAGSETQETIETEARDNPRPGVRQAYKPTNGGQSQEMGSGLQRVSKASTSYQPIAPGVLQELLRRTTAAGDVLYRRSSAPPSLVW